MWCDRKQSVAFNCAEGGFFLFFCFLKVINCVTRVILLIVSGFLYIFLRLVNFRAPIDERNDGVSRCGCCCCGGCGGGGGGLCVERLMVLPFVSRRAGPFLPVTFALHNSWESAWSQVVGCAGRAGGRRSCVRL